MKTNSIVILALLGKASSHQLNQNSAASIFSQRSLYADDFASIGEDKVEQINSQDIANYMSGIENGVNHSWAQKSARSHRQSLVQNQNPSELFGPSKLSSDAAPSLPSELGIPGLGPAEGSEKKDEAALKLKAAKKAKAEAAAKQAELAAKQAELKQAKEEAAKLALENDRIEAENQAKEEANKRLEEENLQKEIAQKQVANVAEMQEIQAKNEAKEAEKQQKELEQKEKKLMAEELKTAAHEQSVKESEENEKKETVKSKTCKINKFDGLCRSSDGTKFHEGGKKASGVNEWVGLDSEGTHVSSQKHKHHHKKEHKQSNKKHAHKSGNRQGIHTK